VRVRRLALALLVVLAGCDLPGREYGVHRVRVDSVVVPDTVVRGTPLEIRILGLVGASSCDELERIERVRTETAVVFELWTRHPRDDGCTETPVMLDTTLLEPAPAGDSIVIVVRGTDETRRTVHVRWPRPPRREVRLHYHRGDTLASVVREVPDAPATLLRATLMELLEGPTAAERDAGLTSFFSDRTAGLLHDATVEDGFAVVDFDEALRRAIPNASTSAGSRQLLRELNATVFQLPAVDSVEYRLGGRCDAFWNFLQYPCQVVRRSGTAL